MIWAVFILVALAIFGVLGAFHAIHLSYDDVHLLTQSGLVYLLSTLLVGCAFLCFKLNQITVSHFKAKATLWTLQALLVAMMVMLFVVRTLGVELDFARHIPQKGYAITADVHVKKISDGVYDKVLGRHYRQEATLSQLAFADGQKIAKTTANPFGVQGDTLALPVLPNTMNVMLSAWANDKNNFNKLNDLKPNTTTKMTLLITPVPHDVSESGFDGYRWLRTRHIHANAKIIAIDGQVSSTPSDLVGKLEQMRWRLRSHFYQDWHALGSDERESKALTLALLTGDRALIGRETKELYQFAGISHLLAISGTHVVFLAMILAWGLIKITDRFPMIYQTIARQNVRLVMMVGASLIYALFTGFDVPAVRTVYMLLVVGVARWLAVPLSDFAILAWVALGMIWLDPVMVWQAGFWLSFVAVGLLMSFGKQEFDEPTFEIKNRMVGLLKLQTYLFFAMLPLSILLFGKVSLWGLFVNLFAVGLFGAVVVPINLLAGVAFAILPFLADVLWGISEFILLILNNFLKFLQNTGEFWLYQSIGVAGVVCLMLAVMCVVVPMIGRKYALIPLMACWFVMSDDVPNTQLSVAVLESDDDKVAQILIRQNRADDSVNGQAVWLLLSDFGSGQSPDGFAKNLSNALKKHRVNHLTGVIVQTPSTMMGQSLSLIGQDIPIYRYWQAGHDKSSLPSVACQAGRSWTGQGMSVQALTGWVDIRDEKVWGCAVRVVSDYQPMVQGGVGHSVQNPAMTGGSELIFDGATDGMTWQMYDMMCRTNGIEISRVDGWFSHSRHATNEQMMTKFSPKFQRFSDKNTANNRKKLLGESEDFGR